MDKKKLKILRDVEITDDDSYLELQDDYHGFTYTYAPCGGGGGGCGRYGVYDGRGSGRR